MKIGPPIHYEAILRAITERTRWKSSFVADVSVFAGVLAILYAIVVSGRIWFAPFTPVAHISSSPRALPLYAAYSIIDGVPVGAGHHRIELLYRPVSFYLGGSLSIASILVIFLIGWFTRRREDPELIAA